MAIALIPARGGSKRIPKKNIKSFLGKPIIAYSIEAAQRAGIFSRVIVSTDSQEIADVALSLGAEVPGLRSVDTADDYSTLADVIIGESCRLNFDKDELVCCLLATVPFISEKDLKLGYEWMVNSSVETVFAACGFPHPIQRAINIADGHCKGMFFPEHAGTRTNDLPEAYYDLGQFYWVRLCTYSKHRSFFTDKSRAITIPPWRAQDIDSEQDWAYAEKLFRLDNY